MVKIPGCCVIAFLISDILHLNIIARREDTVLSQPKKKWIYFTVNSKISKAFEFDHERWWQKYTWRHSKWHFLFPSVELFCMAAFYSGNHFLCQPLHSHFSGKMLRNSRFLLHV